MINISPCALGFDLLFCNYKKINELVNLTEHAKDHIVLRDSVENCLLEPEDD